MTPTRAQLINELRIVNRNAVVTPKNRARVQAALDDLDDRKMSIKKLIDENCELEARVIFLETAIREAQNLLEHSSRHKEATAFGILEDARHGSRQPRSQS